MNDELEDRLKESEALAAGAVIDCEDGWYDLVQALLSCVETKDARIRKIYKKGGLLEVDFLSLGSSPDFNMGVAKAFREMSHGVCDMCGNKGMLSKKNAEYRVLCVDHVDSEGFSLF